MENNGREFLQGGRKQSNVLVKAILFLLLVCNGCIHLSGCGSKNAMKLAKSEIEGEWRVDVCLRTDQANIDKSIETIYKFVVVQGKYGGYVVEDVGHSFIDVDLSSASGIQFDGFKLCGDVGPIYKSDTGWFFSVGRKEYGLQEEREILYGIYAPRRARGRFMVDYVLQCQRHHLDLETEQKTE